MSATENTAELLRLLSVDRLLCEFWNERWHWPSNAEPLAVITYASEPSPETGHVGWYWWALGKMGEAKTYAEAKLAAEAAVRAKRDADLAAFQRLAAGGV